MTEFAEATVSIKESSLIKPKVGVEKEKQERADQIKRGLARITQLLPSVRGGEKPQFLEVLAGISTLWKERTDEWEGWQIAFQNEAQRISAWVLELRDKDGRYREDVLRKIFPKDIVRGLSEILEGNLTLATEEDELVKIAQKTKLNDEAIGAIYQVYAAAAAADGGQWANLSPDRGSILGGPVTQVPPPRPEWREPKEEQKKRIKTKAETAKDISRNPVYSSRQTAYFWTGTAVFSFAVLFFNPTAREKITEPVVDVGLEKTGGRLFEAGSGLFFEEGDPNLDAQLLKAGSDKSFGRSPQQYLKMTVQMGGGQIEDFSKPPEELNDHQRAKIKALDEVFGEDVDRLAKIQGVKKESQFSQLFADVIGLVWQDIGSKEAAKHLGVLYEAFKTGRPLSQQEFQELKFYYQGIVSK